MVKYYIEYEKKNNKKNWKIGDILRYTKTNEKVKLLSIHYDDIIPYYTIEMSNGHEKQTTIDNLNNL